MLSRKNYEIEYIDFEISEEDMRLINAMTYCGYSGLDPNEVDF